MIDMEKTFRIVTHNGRFHADELLATAALSLLLEREGRSWEVVRTRDPKKWEGADFVVDVGGEYDPANGLFDHHQPGGAGAHENGIPYSSFGAVWKVYGERLCGRAEAAEFIERRLVYPIDMADNGIEVYSKIHDDIHPYLLHSFVSVMVPTWKEPENNDQLFLETMHVMRRLLQREIICANDRIEAEEHVEHAYRKSLDKRIIVLDARYPFGDFLSRYPEPLYVVKPKSQSTDWEVEAVRTDIHTFKNRKDLPVSWGGMHHTELARITGVPDAVFCHLKLFVAVAGSRTGALALAQLALEG